MMQHLIFHMCMFMEFLQNEYYVEWDSSYHIQSKMDNTKKTQRSGRSYTDFV